MHGIRTFWRDERGAQTVEFILWIPLFLFFLVATVDVSMIYLTHTEMWNVARDAARRITTGDLEPGADAERFIANSLALYDRAEDDGANSQYSIQVTENAADEEVVVRIATWVAESGMFGLFGLFQNGEEGWSALTLETTVTMRMEPRL